MKKPLIALAMGTLVLGITEFVMMAILPTVARSLAITIPTAGHLISAYAIGVAVGAPLLVFAHRFRPKSILLFLCTLMLVGAAISVVAPSYWVLLAARFVSGLPHGAYFGVASIVAVRLADERHKTSAVTIMSAGMTFANLLAVPLASSLCALLSWRFPFVLAIACAVAVVWLVWRWVPELDALPTNGFKGQFRFLGRREPWLVLMATMLGNGGIFCWYSYVAPVLTQDSGFAPALLPMLMMAAGSGMVAGNLISGRLSDRHSPERVGTCVQLLAALCLLTIFFAAPYPWLSAALMMVCTGSLFALSGPEQYLIIKHSAGGEMLGGACVQMAFNLGNAVGAFAGGLPIAAGLSPRHAALVGVPLCAAGFVCFLLLARGRTATPTPTRQQSSATP